MASVNTQTTAEDGYIRDAVEALTVAKTDPEILVLATSEFGESSPTAGEYYRGFFFFPAPALPAGAHVTRVRFRYTVGSGYDDGDLAIWLYVSNRADLGTTLETADYNTIFEQQDNVNVFKVRSSNYGALPVSGNQSVDLPPQALNRTGTTNVMMMGVASPPAPPSASYLEVRTFEYSTGAFRAYLQVDYELGGHFRRPPVGGTWYGEATPQRQRRSHVPAVAHLPRARKWLSTVADAWRREQQQPPARPAVPTTNPVLAVRRWWSTVVEAWTRPAAPAPRRARLPQEPPPPDPPFTSRRPWLTVIDAWHRPATPPQTARRIAPPMSELFSPRRWLLTVIDWWKTVDIFGRRPPHPPPAGTAVVTPPSPALDDQDCYPLLPAPVTAFSRDAALTASYARMAVMGGGAYTREAFGGLGATRYAAPVSGFTRLDDPHCVPGMGYGDGYGINYGGGVDVGD